MLVQVRDLEIAVFQVKTRDAKRYGFVGWCWHECRRPAVGPFPTPVAALRDLADRIENGTMPEPSTRAPSVIVQS